MKNDFEKGNIDRFNFTGQNLGEKRWTTCVIHVYFPLTLFIGGITNVELSKSGKDDWKCDYVRVIDVTGKRAYLFNFGGKKISINPTKGKPHASNPKDPVKKPAAPAATPAPATLKLHRLLKKIQ